MTFAIYGVGLHAPLMFRCLLGTMRLNLLDNVGSIRTALGHFKRPFRYIGGQIRGTGEGRPIDARLGFSHTHDALRMSELHLTRAGQRQLGKLTAKRHDRAAWQDRRRAAKPAVTQVRDRGRGHLRDAAAMFGKKSRHRGPTAEYRNAQMRFDVKAKVPQPTLRIDAGVRSRRDMLEPLHKTE